MIDGAALQVNVYAAFVFFGPVLKAEFAAYLLDAGFYLLDVVAGVVATFFVN